MHWEGISASHDTSIPLRVPSVSLVDRSAMLPLDLRRFRLVNDYYPFAEDLLADASRDDCAYCLTFAPVAPPWDQPAVIDRPRYPGWETNLISQLSLHMETCFYTSEGSGPAHWANLVNSRPPSAMVIVALGQVPSAPCVPAEPRQALFSGCCNPSIPSDSLSIALSYMLCHNIKNLGNHTMLFTKCEGVRVMDDVPNSVEGGLGDSG